MAVPLEVKDFRVRSLDLDFHEVSWKLESTSEDVLDYSFQLLRSESPSGPFDELTGQLDDTYLFIDNVIQVANRWRKYYYLLRITQKSSNDCKDYGPVAKEPDPDLVAQELRRHMMLLFREFAGRRCWVLPVRTFGKRCFLPGTPMQGAVIGASRALYKGKTVQLTTEKGRRLTVTANHPVLTSQGLTAAQSIRIGDYLVCYGTETGISPSALGAQRYEQQEPTLAENIFRALAKRMRVQTTGTISLDFHGEAQRFIGDVEVVGSYGNLLLNKQASFEEHARQLVLEQASFRKVAGSDLRSENALLQRLYPSRRCPVCSSGLSSSVLGGTFEPQHILSFGLAAQANSSLIECRAESGSRNAQLPSELIDRGAGLVSLDKVIDTRENDYLGHVYDFETTTGWIVASNIVTSNCDCWNASLQKRSRSGCITCFDTGWVRGYMSPIETWIQFDPTTKADQHTNVGKQQQQNTTARFCYYPTVKPDDLIIEGENNRWKVVTVSGTEQGRAVVHQEVSVHQVPPKDIEYKVPLHLQRALKDLWLNPSRNYTNPQTLEAFLDEEIPDIFALYPTTYPRQR